MSSRRAPRDYGVPAPNAPKPEPEPMRRHRRTRGLRVPSASETIRGFREKFDEDELLKKELENFENTFECKSMDLAGTFNRSFTVRLSKTMMDKVPKWWLQHEIDKKGYDVAWETSEFPDLVLRVTLRTRPKQEYRAPPLAENPLAVQARPAPKPKPVRLGPIVPIAHEQEDDEEEAEWYAVRD